MRVSPITLVIFIVLSVFCLVFSYVFYSARTTLETELGDARTSLANKNRAYEEQSKLLKELLDAVGYNLPQITDVTGSTSDTQPAQKLDDLLKKKIETRDNLVKEIGVEITDVDASSHSLYLQQTIDGGLAAGATPPELAGTLVGKLIDALRDAARNAKENEDVIKKGSEEVSALNQSTAQKDAEIAKAVAEWDDKIKAAWDNRVATREKLMTDRKTWAAEVAELTDKRNLDKSIQAKAETRLVAQADMASPPDGKIIEYDWKAKRGTINLGANGGAKNGYQFDVFRRYPGPDTAERRTYLAKIILIDVQPDVSLFAIVPSEFDKSGQTMAAGDFVTNRVLNAYRAKKYYIAGFFPRGSDYEPDGLAGMVKRFGGTVQDQLTLDTDYVIVGVVDEGGMTDWSDEAKKAIAKAKADFDLARRYNIEVLSVDRFLALINQK